MWNKDILWCSPHPNHYHSYLTDCLRSAGISVDTLYFNKLISKYPWKTNFAVEESYFLNKQILSIDWKFLFSHIRSSPYRVTIIAGWNEPTMMALLNIYMLLGKKYVVYTDTPSERPRKGLKQMIRNIWLNKVLENATYILTTGTPGVKFFTSRGIKNEKVVNLPFLTNLDYFTPVSSLEKYSSSSTQNLLNIFSSGRLDNRHKGYDIVLSALSEFKKLGYKFTYRIAGDGPDRDAIEKQIRSSHLELNVELLGWLEPDELKSEYQNADLFLHGARLDPFPNAILEAMACGLPVVSSDSSGSGIDRIENGINGFIFSSGNPDDLLDKMLKVVKMPRPDLLIMGKEARKTSEKWDYKYHVNTIKMLLQ